MDHIEIEPCTYICLLKKGLCVEHVNFIGIVNFNSCKLNMSLTQKCLIRSEYYNVHIYTCMLYT